MLKKIAAGCLCAGVGWFSFGMKAESIHPGITSDVNKDAVKSFGSTASASGYMVGSVARATGPAVAGGKDALQSSGLGQMLTPPTTAAAGAVPPAADQPSNPG